MKGKPTYSSFITKKKHRLINVLDIYQTNMIPSLKFFDK